MRDVGAYDVISDIAIVSLPPGTDQHVGRHARQLLHAHVMDGQAGALMPFRIATSSSSGLHFSDGKMLHGVHRATGGPICVV